MKKLFFTLGLLLISLQSNAQDIEYKEYSYAEFFQMIEEEEDSVFEMSNIQLTYEQTRDSLFYVNRIAFNNSQYSRENDLVVTKKLVLTNVHFNSARNFSGLHKIKFLKNVSLQSLSGSLSINKSTFVEGLDIRSSNQYQLERLNILSSTIKGQFRLIGDQTIAPYVQIADNQINTETTSIMLESLRQFFLVYNQFKSQSIRIQLPLESEVISSQQNLLNNSFDSKDFSLALNASASIMTNVMIANESIHPIFLFISDLQVGNRIEWQTFSDKVIDGSTYYEWARPSQYRYSNLNGFEPDSDLKSDRNIRHYLEHARIEDRLVHEAEITIRSKFYDHYRSIHNIASANAVYLEIKDLETERLAYLYHQNPSFDSFFTLQINRFLKVFSDYGTRPAKAVVFSFYVILAFALVYLFFPNSWDSHGKDRIFHRYAFFLKYMRKDAGLHEVYLDEKKDEIMHHDEFKQLIIDSNKAVPPFFIKSALYLYKWTHSGALITSALLKRTDIMKGTWEDLPPANRIAKGFLLISAFLLVLIWDLIVKTLNALMLSINTFTALGFGEIPIKGLPRYLAIIQGFIGWFMLTIFSVSLISQLLN